MTPNDASVFESVIMSYCRAIVHMRQQKEDGQFGLVIGAGASKDFGFPDWPELVVRIAADRRVAAGNLLANATSTTSQSQLLYQHYRAKKLMLIADQTDRFNRTESILRGGWRRIVHDALYRGVPTSPVSLLKRDRYLRSYLQVIRETRLTINYNFDDSLQRLLAHEHSHALVDPEAGEEQAITRGFTTVWSPDIQMYPKNGVIYHPNGYLPRDLKERPSDQLVFLEDTFADQLIASMHGHYASLAYHLAQSTRLLIGMSLEDSTVKHLLRQHAHIHPGHYHYYVAYVPDGATRDPAFERAATAANFETYNLITLFLTAEGIDALGRLLALPQVAFNDLTEQLGCQSVYRFLLTGAVSAGKSTTVSHFRSLQVHDEWLDARAKGMDKDHTTLPAKDKKAIDLFVAKQVGLKNRNMLLASRGIHLVDRAPFDAFAFTPRRQWKTKAKQLRRAIAPRKAKRAVCPAHVIILVAEPEVLAARAIARNKEGMDKDYLDKQQNTIQEVYGLLGAGTSVVDTRDKPVGQVCKEVARVIHQQGPFTEADLESLLTAIEKGGADVLSS